MMPSPVNICAAIPFPAAVVTMLALVAGCAGRPGLTSPWFDPTTPAFNGGVGQPGALAPASDEARRAHARDLDRSWAREEVEALEERLARERKAAGLASRPKRSTSAKRTTSPKQPPAPRAATPRPERPEPGEIKPAPAKKAAKKTARSSKKKVPLRVKAARPKVRPKTRPKPRQVARAKPAKPQPAKVAPPPTPDGAHPRAGDKAAMGDGSVAGEMVAAARRLVGLAYDDDRNTFLRHLLVAAAVDVKLTAPREAFDAGVIEALGRRGWHLNRAQARQGLQKGDLIVFATQPQLIAVVESVSASGVATCIGPRFGRVGRFVMSLQFPKARRNEATKEILNDRVTKPGVAGSRRASATLAGELFTVAIRATFQ